MVNLLPAVAASNHVIRKDYVALFGKVDTTAGHGTGFAVLQPSSAPVSVRTDNTREWSFHPFRTVKVSGGEKTGIGFKVGLLNGIILAFNPPEDMRVQRCFFGHRGQSVADQNMFSEFRGFRHPFGFGIARKCVECIDISCLIDARIVHRLRDSGE